MMRTGLGSLPIGRTMKTSLTMKEDDGEGMFSVRGCQ